MRRAPYAVAHGASPPVASAATPLPAPYLVAGFFMAEASALLFDGRIVVYVHNGDGAYDAWCEGRKVKMNDELREAINADRERQAKAK